MNKQQKDQATNKNHLPPITESHPTARHQNYIGHPMVPGFGWVAVSFAALNSSAAGRPMERSKVTMRSLVEWEMMEKSPINVDDGWMDDG